MPTCFKQVGTGTIKDWESCETLQKHSTFGMEKVIVGYETKGRPRKAHSFMCKICSPRCETRLYKDIFTWAKETQPEFAYK